MGAVVAAGGGESDVAAADGAFRGGWLDGVDELGETPLVDIGDGVWPQFADFGDQQGLDLVLAVAAARTGLGVGHHLEQRVVARVDRAADGAGGDAVAVADLGLVRDELAVHDGRRQRAPGKSRPARRAGRSWPCSAGRSGRR